MRCYFKLMSHADKAFALGALRQDPGFLPKAGRLVCEALGERLVLLETVTLLHALLHRFEGRGSATGVLIAQRLALRRHSKVLLNPGQS
jgi:hypothetical protein